MTAIPPVSASAMDFHILFRMQSGIEPVEQDWTTYELLLSLVKIVINCLLAILRGSRPAHRLSHIGVRY